MRKKDKTNKFYLAAKLIVLWLLGGYVPFAAQTINRAGISPGTFPGSSGRTPSYPMGGTAEQVKELARKQALQQMNYHPPVIPPSDPRLLSQAITTEHYNQQQELAALLQKVRSAESSRRVSFSYYKSAEFAAKTQPYTDALLHLKEQLAGKRRLSVSDAYFYIEYAHGNTYLSKKEYDRLLKESTGFIKEWLSQNGYSLKDNEALHLGIQKFLSDTLTIKSPLVETNRVAEKKITHFPFFYDYDDFAGEKDYRNYFVTKCLATGSGQCNSLPALYNAFAQQLGAKSYLSFVPLHSLVKYPDKNGKIHNYEATSNWKISDKWYQDNMFISTQAKQSKIYLDTLNYRQIVANCALDLAIGYMKKHGIADAEFVNECIETAAPYFPKDNNIYIYFIISEKLAFMLERELYKNNIRDLKEIDRYPQTAMLHRALLENEAIIKKLGWQKQPPGLYNRMMEEHEFKGRKQAEKNINGKEKRHLFIESF